MKTIAILILVCIACRVLAGRWPWQLLRAADRSADRAQARAVLGVRPGAGREEIVDAHRRVVANVHPDRGGSNELVHEANAARDLLLGAAPLDKR